MNNQIEKIEIELETQESVLGIIRIHQVKVFWRNAEEPTFDNKLSYVYEYHEIDEIREAVANHYQISSDKIKITKPFI